MNVQFRVEEYRKFGRCLVMENGVVEAYVTLDFGPRVIRFGFVGGQNLFFNDMDDVCTQSGPQFDEMFGPGEKWYIRGGHRIWTSPESMPASYYPDNAPVPYETTARGAVFTPAPQRVNEVAHTLAIEFTGEAALRVTNRVRNVAAQPQEYAAWALTVLAPGGVEIVPQPQEDTGLLANRVLAVWPYAAMDDDRVYWGRDFITLRQTADAAGPFKFGINNTRAWSAYLLGKDLFVKRMQFIPGAQYPDGGMSFETYRNEHFIEMESLSPIRPVLPQESVETVETWTLQKVDAGFDRRDPASVARFVRDNLGEEA